MKSMDNTNIESRSLLRDTKEQHRFTGSYRANQPWRLVDLKTLIYTLNVQCSDLLHGL